MSGYLEKGTWLQCSLPNGSLPTSSPFGDLILYVSIATVLNQFRSPQLYLREVKCNYNGSGNSYYNLHLVEKGSFVPSAYRPLNIRKNRYLVLDAVTQTYSVMPFEDDSGERHWVSLCVEKLCENIEVSPGNFTKRRVILGDDQHAKKNAIWTSPLGKRRRLELKSVSRRITCTKQMLEGSTYRTEVDLGAYLDHGMTEILTPAKPVIETEPVSVHRDTPWVFFDLETTGFEKKDIAKHRNKRNPDDTTSATQMESITTLSHGTCDGNHALIRMSEYLKEGTWFLCSLPYGSRPIFSPFGNNIMYVPKATVLDQFRSPKLYLREVCPNFNGSDNTYYNLHLFEEGSFVPSYYEHINIRDNKYLVLDTDNKTYSVMPFLEYSGEKNWVCLCVEKVIDIPSSEQMWIRTY